MDGGIFASLQSVASGASPQGGRAKRARADGGPGQDDDDNNLIKIVGRACSVILAEQRNLDSKIGSVLLLPPEHGLTKMLVLVKKMYADKQPPRQKGQPGERHPWGAPRNVNTAAMIDYTVTKVYGGDGGEELKTTAKGIWDAEYLNQLVTKIWQLAKECSDNHNFVPLDPLCKFFRFREGRDGRGILEITGGTGRCFDPELRKKDLCGVPLEDIWGLLLLPYAEYLQTGPAPQGRLERLVNKQIFFKK